MTIPPRSGSRFTTQDGSPAWYTQAAEQAYRKFVLEGKTYGSLLTHGWLYDALGVQDPKTVNGGYDAIQKATFTFASAQAAFSKLLLISHQMALDNVRGNGWRVVMPNEQAKWAMSEGMDEVQSALSKMSSRIKHTNTALLDRAQRQDYAKVQDHAAMVKRWVDREANRPFKRWTF